MTFEERKKQVKHYLGKKVIIGIDRPIGYIHKKRNVFINIPDKLRIYSRCFWWRR